MLNKNFNVWLLRFTILMGSTTGGSGLLSLNGFIAMMIGESWFKSTFAPILITVLFTAISIVTWRFFFEKWPRATWKKRKQMLVPLIILIAGTFSLSTYFSLNGLAGGMARNRNLNLIIEDGGKIFAKLYELRLQEVQLAPTLREISDGYSRLARCEKRFGCVTGERGTGQIVNDILESGKSYSAAAGMLEGQLRKLNRLFPKGKNLLENLRSICKHSVNP